MRPLNKLKWWLERVCFSHPVAYTIGKKIVQAFPTLLPHDKDFLAYVHFLSPDGGLFLDIGANDGISALSFNQLARNYKIFSIEPNERHRIALERLSKKLPAFSYLISAAGVEPMQVRLYTPVYGRYAIHSAASFSVSHIREALGLSFSERVMQRIRYTEQLVAVIVLDDLDIIPNIIKIDAEGSDLDVLMGLERTLRRSRAYVMLEFHESYYSSLLAFCTKLGYQLYRYDQKADVFVEFYGEKTKNVFAIPGEATSALPIKRSNHHNLGI